MAKWNIVILGSLLFIASAVYGDSTTPVYDESCDFSGDLTNCPNFHFADYKWVSKNWTKDDGIPDLEYDNSRFYMVFKTSNLDPIKRVALSIDLASDLPPNSNLYVSIFFVLKDTSAPPQLGKFMLGTKMIMNLKPTDYVNGAWIRMASDPITRKNDTDNKVTLQLFSNAATKIDQIAIEFIGISPVDVIPAKPTTPQSTTPPPTQQPTTQSPQPTTNAANNRFDATKLQLLTIAFSTLILRSFF